MTVSRTYFGTYFDFGVDKQNHQALVTIAIPLADGGPALTELTAWQNGIASAPIAVTFMVGRAAEALRDCLAPDAAGEDVPAALREAIRLWWTHDVNKPSWLRDDQNERLVTRIAAALSDGAQP